MLRWIEGFEGYGTSIGAVTAPTGVLGRRYLVGKESKQYLHAGRFTGYALRLTYDYTCYLISPHLTTDDSIYVGFAFQITKTLTNNDYIFALYDGGDRGVTLKYQTGGEIGLYCGAAHLATTIGLGLVPGIWYYIELYVKCHNTAGAYELRVNESNVLNANGVDTRNGDHDYHDRFGLYGNEFNPNGVIFDDLYICDSTGSTNNNFLGNVRVLAMFPDGDSTTAWTRNTGNSSYALVDENPCDDDTTYVETDTVNATDLYTYDDLTNLGDIYGLQINTDCRETGTDCHDLLVPISSGAAQDDGTSNTVGTISYVTKTRISEIDPGTTLAWSTLGLQLASFGVKL